MDGAVTVAGNRNTTGLRPHWVKGQSGNPGGRQSLLTKYIRQETKDGKEMADFALQVLRSELTSTVVTKDGKPVEVGPSFADRLQALNWLADHSFSKVKDAADAGEEAEDLRKLFDEAAKAYGWRVLAPEPTEGEAQCVTSESQP
jgi:hypothetical protein